MRSRIAVDGYGGGVSFVTAASRILQTDHATSRRIAHPMTVILWVVYVAYVPQSAHSCGGCVPLSNVGLWAHSSSVVARIWLEEKHRTTWK